MSEAKVIFTFLGIETTILCTINEKIKNILKRFSAKVEIDINKVYCIYNANKVNEELKFEELANKEDKLKKIMNIVVYEINNSTLINDDMQKSKEFICPKCNENILIKINDYKISMNCKNNHKIENIKINEFEGTQKINISKIICDNCKQINKSKTYKNEFYKCIECNNNICPLCKSLHNINHRIIEYDKKNYICYKHKEVFFKFCQKCNMNICKNCEKEHKNHNIKNLGGILPNENEIKILKEYIDKLNKDISNIINKLKEVLNTLEIDYNLSNINNENINYEKYQNINEFIKFNNIVIKDIKEIISDNDLENKFKKIIIMHIKMNSNIEYNNYIIGEIYIKEENINKNIRIINSFEQCKRDNKWNDNKEDYKKENEKEIKEKCIIEINNDKIPFSYFYKFREKGNYIIKYSFKKNLNKINHMFYKCTSLKTIDMSNFNSNDVINMGQIFLGCIFLTKIILTNLNTQNVIDFNYMFSE